MSNRLLTALRILAALLLAGLILGLCLREPGPASRMEVAASILVGASLGLWLRHFGLAAWGRSRLEKAEALWAGGAPPEAVMDALPRRLRIPGELGYRMALLRGQARWTLGQRDQAWLEVLEAQLARLPFWLRPVAGRWFRVVPGRPSDRRLAWGRRLIRLAPRMARLRHLQGILLLRRAPDAFLPAAWERFEEALPLASDDPMLLEDLMLAGYHHGQEALAARALRLLLERHADPRLPWDRGTPAFQALRRGDWTAALVLVAPLSPEQRHQPIHWLAEIVARRSLGDREGAWRAVEAGLERLPGAFRLWMERYQTALERREDPDALQSLEQAWGLIPEGLEGETLRQEWFLRRAEFAFWWEDDPEFAAETLAKVPPEMQGDHHPPLALQIRVALGEFEAAYQEVTGLLARKPEDLDLLLLQAECLAGLDAWEALPPFLEGLRDGARARAEFWHLRGLARANLGEPLPARLDLEHAARMMPYDVRFLLDAGHACAELGEWERAEAHWREALQVDARSEEALIHLAEARRELQDPEGSRRYLRECLLHHPESAEAQARLAELEAN